MWTLTNDNILDYSNIFLHLKASFRTILLSSKIIYHLSFFPIFSSMTSLILFVVGRVHKSGKKMEKDTYWKKDKIINE